MPLANIAARTAIVFKRLANSAAVTTDFVNAGTLGAVHAQLTLDVLAIGIGTTAQTIDNRGTIMAACGSVTIHGNRTLEQNHTTLLNEGTVLALGGGVVDIQADLHQSPTGTVAIVGGKVLLEGAASGGSIQITSGMLAFGLFGRLGGPLAAGQCSSPIQFLGHDGVLDFSGVAVSEVFRAETQELLVSAPVAGHVTQIADLHLTGRVYSSLDFTIHGADIVFHH